MKLYNVWDASRQVLSIYNEEPLHINIEYSDKMSRTSQSLVDVNIYKSLLNLKTKYTNWEEQLERVNPYKHVCDYTFKEILEFSEIKFNSLLHIGSKDNEIENIIKNKDFYSTSSLFKEYYDQYGYSRTIVLDDHTTESDLIICCKDYYSSKDINTIFRLQQDSGNLILFINDLTVKPTCQLLYLLASCYESTFIIRPRVCPYNQYYLVCRNNTFKIKLPENDDFIKSYDININEKLIYDYNNDHISNEIKAIENMNIQQYENFQALVKTKFMNDFIDKKPNNCKHIKRETYSIIKNANICKQCLMLII